MADKELKSIKFPGLADTYIIKDYTDEIDAKVSEAETDLMSVLSDVSTVQTTTNNTPYSFRKCVGGHYEMLDKVVGGSVAWNQLTQNGNFADGTSHWEIYSERGSFTVSGGVATVTTTAQGQQLYSGYSPIAGHVYIAFAELKTSSATNLIKFKTAESNKVACTATTNWQAIASLGKRNSNSHTYTYFEDERTSGWDSWQVRNVNTIDLTQLFGSTVADAIYAMEQATAGSGVAYFRSLFGASYYPYNSGELISVEATSHDTTGFNQWDEEWEVRGNYIWSKNTIPVFPNTTYYIKTPTKAGINAVDSEGTYVSYIGYKGNETFTTPSDCHFIQIQISTSAYGTTYNHDICINISSSLNGKYEPYKKNSYPLADVTLRGIPKWSNGLYYDGDTYEADGTVTRRYRFIELNGTEAWSVNSATTGLYYISPYGIKDGANYKANGYVATTVAGTDMVAGESKIAGKNINFKTSYATLDAFKTAIASNPIALVYEAETPTTETADPYQKAQICDPNGTEEFVSDTIVPTGHETEYPLTINDIAPSANGTYTLKCTVSGGVATYEWVSE